MSRGLIIEMIALQLQCVISSYANCILFSRHVYCAWKEEDCMYEWLEGQ